MFFSKTFRAYWDICLFFFFLSCVSGNDNLFLISLKSILCTNFGSNILQETMTITTTMSEKKSKIRTNHHQTLDIINLLLLFNLINNNRSEKTKIIIIINKIKTSEKGKKMLVERQKRDKKFIQQENLQIIIIIIMINVMLYVSCLIVDKKVCVCYDNMCFRVKKMK